MSDEIAPAAADAPAPVEGAAPVADAANPPIEAVSGDAAAAAAVETAPEAYAWNVPDGVTLQQGVLGEFESYARERSMTQADAQKLLDFGIRLQQSNAEEAARAHAEQRAAWEQEARNSKEFGGEQFDANLASARDALAKVAAPGLMELLESSNWGSHPALIGTLMNIAKLVKDDTFRFGAPAAAEKTRASRMFPTMN